MTAKTSRIAGLYRLGLAERLERVAAAAGLDSARVRGALVAGGLDVETADAMVENALGTLALPFGVALNMQVNGRDYLVPMAIEEPSVIAAASHGAKRARAGGGFTATSDPPLMAAQIEVHGVRDATAATEALHAANAELLALADEAVPGLVDRGGGAREIGARDLGDGLLVVHVTVDCCDAMGANLLNTVAERVGPRAAAIAGGSLGLRILSNFCDRRCTRVSVRLPVEALGDPGVLDGLEVAAAIARASSFAERDPYRAATHNKGIMNGIDAVVVATGNDWRAVEAGAHAFAARHGRYGPLATWKLSADQTALEGRLELPLALGVVGGALRAHRGARLALELLGTTSACELAMVAGAAGLATNLAALRALCTEGIQRGHMALHRRASAAKLP
jgi:hydroxymethylglutaryl-CoA reductase